MSGVVREPGLYQMDEATYFGDPVPGGSLSCSGAKLLLPPSCPATFAYLRDHPRPPTEAMDFGSAAHREVLGAGRDYAIWPGDSWSERGARAFREEARAAGKVPLKAAEHAQIKEMAAAIETHPSAALLLRAEEVMPEISLFWQDSLDGLLDAPIWRRARMDAVRLAGRVVITDFKTTASADPGEFGRQAGRLRYTMQSEWYRRAVTCVLGDVDPLFLFVAQEKDPPYPVLICELGWEARAAGEARNAAACRIFARCQAAGEWPGHQQSGQLVATLDIPRWAL